ncbi:transposase [Bifidobacterium longum]|uniref:transposase n=1 Tax=Bifidobacterium longum TaxID=216816 RepID=UPI003B9AB158
MVEGGSEKAFAQWLAERPQSFCEKVEAVAMDAFAGYKKAAARQVPHAVEILDPFHIVKRGCLIVCVWDHLIERKRSW